MVKLKLWIGAVATVFALGFIKFSDAYSYDTYYYTQKVDHFSFHNNDTYQQRYLVNDGSWTQDGGPIFFYTGNEGDIEWFAKNTGFMWDIAPQFKAMLVFAEHRFYGVSLPYGNKSYEDIKYLGYLSAEQALADFAELIYYIKKSTPGAENSSVIVFGGSYGGMLAAWFRMKYPHLADGAIAASAPVLQFPGITACGAYNQIVSRVFNASSPQCAASVRKSWDVINTMGNTTEGRAQLSSLFRLCAPLSNDSDVHNFKDWLTEMYGDVAMVNYPYPANFLEPLPAWPINVMCSHLTDSSLEGEELLEKIFQATNVYFNYTGQTECMDTGTQSTAGSLDDRGWDVQSCSEMVMPMCTDGVRDMFEPADWDYPQFVEDCQNNYNITPRPHQIEVLFGGTNIQQYSNIIFSNGVLDPWSGGGLLKSVSSSIIAILIDQGAHHLDLRSSNPADPPSVIAARETEKSYISKWIRQARRNQKYRESHKLNPILID